MMDDDGRYNGWANYPTWAVNLWLGNEEGLYRECCYMAREALRDAPHDKNVKPWFYPDGSQGEPVWTVEQAARYRLADTFKEWIEELFGLDKWGLKVDLLGYALGEVDWQEIADSWLESAKEEESYV
jgi:hypothetical protein